ncbi:hypothetical protein V6N11_069893 [Hibiscus sabdariffa]|uniref:Uncharacterized protein n=1 Tax=Hibiscus sabdariffa TaxID=183260 RepID=A0ABR2NGZ4_9ROSI
MVVADRRVKGGITRSGTSPPTHGVSGSRFVSLEVEDSKGNEVHDGSHSRLDRGVEVVTICGKQEVPLNSGLVRELIKGDHMVVSINEKGSSYDSKGSRWEQRGKSVMGKGKVEINRRSLQVNCGHEARRTANLVFRRYFKAIVREHRPAVVALFEPHICGCITYQVVKRLGYYHTSRVECHFVYANTCSSRHKHIWPQLEELNPGNSVPWSFGLGISRSTIHLVKRFSLSGPRSVCG